MRWFYANKEDIVGIECTNIYTGKHVLRLTPNSNFTNEGEENQGDTRFIVINVNNKPTIFELQNILLSLQEEYDSSADVNSFYLNGKRVWLDKATRVGLFNILNLEKTAGKEDTTLWFNKTPITINVDKAITLLTAVEMYAKDCYDVTQKHMLEISKLTTIEECLQYDITAGYPDILSFTLTE